MGLLNKSTYFVRGIMGSYSSQEADEFLQRLKDFMMALAT